MAHRFVENPAFRRFLHRIQPAYKLPSRRSISENLVPELYSEVKQAVDDEIKNSSYVSLSFDGWTDNRQRSITNAIVHTPTPFLFESIDDGTNAHTGKSFVITILKINSQFR